MQMGGQSGAEKEVILTPDMPFINETNTVQPGDDSTPAYHFKGQEGYVLFVPAGTLFAPELRAADGTPLDGSTRIVMQKLNKQGDKLGNGVVLNDLWNKYDTEKFRNDPEFMRYTQSDLMLAERERAAIFLDIPEGASAFDPDASNLSIGDTTSEFRTPVEIVDQDKLSPEETAAVKQASQANGGQ